jgi:hypothetical protein
LVVEPAGDEPVLIEGGPSHVSSSPDERPLMIIDSAVSPESSCGQVEDLNEQAEQDYELEEGWLEEQLLDNPGIEVQASESPTEAHISSGTSHLLYYFLVALFLVYLRLCFSL